MQDNDSGSSIHSSVTFSISQDSYKQKRHSVKHTNALNRLITSMGLSYWGNNKLRNNLWWRNARLVDGVHYPHPWKSHLHPSTLEVEADRLACNASASTSSKSSSSGVFQDLWGSAATWKRSLLSLTSLNASMSSSSAFVAPVSSGNWTFPEGGFVTESLSESDADDGGTR